MDRYELTVICNDEFIYRGFFKSINQVVKEALRFDFNFVSFICEDILSSKLVDVKHLASVYISSLEV